MLRIIGALLLVSGTAAWGITEVMKLRERARSLSAVTSSLETVRSEICDRLTPMPELLELMSEMSEYPANLLYKNAGEKMKSIGSKPFSSIWKQAIDETPELVFKAPEKQVLNELGTSLGKYNIEEQRSAITFAQRRLDSLTQKAESERDTQSKVKAALSVAAGVFAVVMLI